MCFHKNVFKYIFEAYGLIGLAKKSVLLCIQGQYIILLLGKLTFFCCVEYLNSGIALLVFNDRTLFLKKFAYAIVFIHFVGGIISISYTVEVNRAFINLFWYCKYAGSLFLSNCGKEHYIIKFQLSWINFKVGLSPSKKHFLLLFASMIALQKWWKMIFISSLKLFWFSRYSNFCLDFLGIYKNSLIRKIRLISKFMTSQPGIKQNYNTRIAQYHTN